MLSRACLLWIVIQTCGAINFPGLTNTNRFNFGRQTYATATCVTSGTPTTVTLAAGEGRIFQSTNYPSNYGNQESCTFNFEPAVNSQLVFSCSAFDVKPTSTSPDLCTGDYVRFYDSTGTLGTSGTRYCYSAPSFTYTNNVNVLFKTNNDGTVSTGFSCTVVSESTATTTTTTTTTTTITTTTPSTTLGTQSTTTPSPSTTTTESTLPSTGDCITIDGPGASKPCKQFTYGTTRTPYDGCINRDTPGQYVHLVPDFGDNTPAPKDEEVDFFETENGGSEFGDFSFGVAPRDSGISFAPRLGTVTRPRNTDQIRTLFWCATEVDPSGYVMEWGKCAAGCKADPAGSYIPLPPAPRSGNRNKGFTRTSRPHTVGQLVELITKGNKIRQSLRAPL